MRRLLALVALLLAPLPSHAEEVGWAATHGRAGFVTAHLYPGATITLAPQHLAAPIVALTFDDGPHGANDPAILDILRTHNAAASFFLIGRNAERHPELVQAMLADGHEVGNHTHDHIRLSRHTAAEQAATIAHANAALALGGAQPRWFRPPFGSLDADTVAIARGQGLETMLWTVDSKDYRGIPAAEVEERVMAGLTPGAVVLLHSNHHNTVEALPNILTRGAALGYRFVTLTEWKAWMERASFVAAAMRAPGP